MVQLLNSLFQGCVSSIRNHFNKIIIKLAGTIRKAQRWVCKASEYAFFALRTTYFIQKHEYKIQILKGMFVGLFLRVTCAHSSRIAASEA